MFGAYWGAKLKRVEHSSHLPVSVFRGRTLMGVLAGVC